MTNFLDRQLQFRRVANAFLLRIETINMLLASGQISTDKFELFLRAFKLEQKLELWAKNKDQHSFVFLKSYDFCKSSGVPGPKRHSGDLQIPEGIYQITNLNPLSNYHLSLRINYPNLSDLFFADSDNTGNDIYIHGGCATTGCITIGDDNIEELYLLVVKAKESGNDINVHIFPCYMNSPDYEALKSEHADNKRLIDFWANLACVFDAFEQSRSLLVISINDRGEYQIEK